MMGMTLNLKTKIILVSLTFIIFGQGWAIPFYSDDFQFLFANPSQEIFRQFYEANPNNDFYRPLQASIMALIQTLFGSDTRPLHLLQIALHAALAIGVASYAKFLTGSARAASIAGFFLIANQSITAGVLSNDTLAQQMGTLFGFLSIYALHRHLKTPKISDIIISLFALLIALFSKETSACFPLIIALLVVVEGLKNPPLKTRIAHAIKLAIPFAAIGGFYLFSRSQVVISKASIGVERYQFAFGTNIIKNIAMLGATPLIPHSTVDTYLAVLNQNQSTLAWVGLLSLISGLLLLGGLYLNPKRGQIAYLSLATLFSMCPAIFLNHVSEVYCYNLLPFLALLVAMATQGWGMRFTLNAKHPLAAALGLLFILHILAISAKTQEMHDCGTRAQNALEELVPLAKSLPQNHRVHLVAHTEKTQPYSVFIIPDLMVLQFGTHMIPQLANRPDLTVELKNSRTYDGETCTQGCQAYHLQGSKIEPYQP